MGEHCPKGSGKNMKFLGLILSLSLLMAGTTAKPIIFPDPVTGLAFTAAGGLVLTAASGATAVVPTATLLLGKALIAKKLILSAVGTGGAAAAGAGAFLSTCNNDQYNHH